MAQQFELNSWTGFDLLTAAVGTFCPICLYEDFCSTLILGTRSMEQLCNSLRTGEPARAEGLGRALLSAGPQCNIGVDGGGMDRGLLSYSNT